MRRPPAPSLPALAVSVAIGVAIVALALSARGGGDGGGPTVSGADAPAGPITTAANPSTSSPTTAGDPDSDSGDGGDTGDGSDSDDGSDDGLDGAAGDDSRSDDGLDGAAGDDSRSDDSRSDDRDRAIGDGGDTGGPASADGDAAGDLDADEGGGRDADDAGEQAGRQGPIEVTLDDFGVAGSGLSGTARRMLESLTALVGTADGTVTIVGHTDDIGSGPENLRLSEARARVVADYLTNLGVDPTRLVVIGMGEVEPIGLNSTAEGRASNRRVVVTIDGDT